MWKQQGLKQGGNTAHLCSQKLEWAVIKINLKNEYQSRGGRGRCQGQSNYHMVIGIKHETSEMGSIQIETFLASAVSYM